jgi:hypothetical protein
MICCGDYGGISCSWEAVIISDTSSWTNDAVVEDTEIMIDGNVKNRTCHA